MPRFTDRAENSRSAATRDWSLKLPSAPWPAGAFHSAAATPSRRAESAARRFRAGPGVWHHRRLPVRGHSERSDVPDDSRFHRVAVARTSGNRMAVAPKALPPDRLEQQVADAKPVYLAGEAVAEANRCL